jgi:hypothetical protein
MTTKIGYSSYDLFSLRFSNDESYTNQTIGLPFLDPDKIKRHTKILGASFDFFDHSKWVDKLEPLAEHVSAKGIFCTKLQNFVKNHSLLMHLHIFREKLSLWWQYCNHNGISTYKDPNWYFINCIRRGPEFGLALKDTFDYSLRKSMSTYPFSVPDDIKEVFLMEDLNSIFPPQHLIVWRIPPDYTDITDYSFTTNIIDKKILSLLEDKINTNINVPKYIINKSNKADHIGLINNKKMFNGVENVLSYKNRSLNDYYPDKLVYSITHVTKSSCEGRICAVATEDSRTLLYDAREYSHILFKGKGRNYYGKKPWLAESKLHQDGSDFLMADQKKCGWTFPFEYLKLAFKVAYEKTNLECFKVLFDIYNEGEVYYIICGEVRKPIRGFTLGMWDNVLSFIMECLFEVFLELEINEDQYPYIEGMFFGDDSVLKCKSAEPGCYTVITELWIKYLYFLIRGGIEINTKKSFFSNFGIFCEMYGDNDTITNHKTVNYLLNALDILLDEFTWERKIKLNAWYTQMTNYLMFLPKNIKQTMTFYINKISEYIIKTSEIEFDKYDHCFAFEAGGWFTELVDGKSTFLLKLSEGLIPTDRGKLVMLEDFPSFVIRHCKKEPGILKSLIGELNVHNSEIDVKTLIKESLINKVIYYEMTSTSKKLNRLKSYYQEYRKKAFLNDPYDDVLSYAYRKCCKNQIFPKDMFTELYAVEDTFVYGVKVRKHKYIEGNYPSVLSSIINIQNVDPEKFDTTFIRENIANIYRDVQSEYPIPTFWLKFLISNRMTLQELEERLEDIGLNILSCRPKYACKKEDFSNDIYPLQNEYCLWDDHLCIYYEIDRQDLSNLVFKSQQDISKYLYEKYYGYEFNYYLAESIFSEPPVDDTSDYTLEEELQIYQEWLEAHQKKNEELPQVITSDINVFTSFANIQENYNEYESDDQEEKEGFYKGVYIKYLDPDNDDFDPFIKHCIDSDIPLDPVEYMDEIREYPQLSYNYQSGSDVESQPDDFDHELEEDPD